MKPLIERDFDEGKIFSRTKYPRKLKKKLKKLIPQIPVGWYCDHCPFHQILEDDPEKDRLAYCAFLNLKSDHLLAEGVKECLHTPFVPYPIPVINQFM